ncbi:MAG: CBS domain-containing protein [Clostridia bacterium]|nr:CBS domain-containing protein [Clostridia bacterium]
MKVNECMCADVYSAKPETTIYDVVKLMQDRKVGCVPICDNNNCIVGLVTDRDILLRGIACDKDTKTTPISEIMTSNVCCCNPEDEVYQAENKMSEYQIRRIPVIENNKVIGILTMGDLAHYDRELGKQEVCTTIGNICSCEGKVKNCC